MVHLHLNLHFGDMKETKYFNKKVLCGCRTVDQGCVKVKAIPLPIRLHNSQP